MYEKDLTTRPDNHKSAWAIERLAALASDIGCPQVRISGNTIKEEILVKDDSYYLIPAREAPAASRRPLSPHDDTSRQPQKDINIDKTYEQMKRCIIGQDELIESVVSGVNYGLVRSRALQSGARARRLPRSSSMLILGPTGCGKTYVVTTLLDFLGIKHFRIDASYLTGEGWRGDNLSDHLKKVQAWQGDNPGKTCVIYVDEVDKVGRDDGLELDGSPGGRTSFNPLPQFLAYMDGGKVPLPRIENGRRSRGSTSSQEEPTLDCNLIIWIFSGSFDGITDCVRARLLAATDLEGERAVRALDVDDLRRRVVVDDLIAFGLHRELCGRIGRIACAHQLGMRDLKEIVSGPSPSCLVSRYSNLLPPGSTLVVTDQAVELTVGRALRLGQGARGLENVLNQPFDRALLEVSRLGSRGEYDVVIDAVEGEMLVYTVTRRHDDDTT